MTLFQVLTFQGPKTMHVLKILHLACLRYHKLMQSYSWLFMSKISNCVIMPAPSIVSPETWVQIEVNMKFDILVEKKLLNIIHFHFHKDSFIFEINLIIFLI